MKTATFDLSMSLWHYTTLHRFFEIWQCKELRPSTYAPPDNFTPTLWFSTHPHYEQTARKRAQGRVERFTMAEMHVLLGLARIEAPDDLNFMHFGQWAQAVSMSDEARISFVQGDIELGANPGDWYASFEILPKTRWKSVEIWNGITWDPRWP